MGAPALRLWARVASPEKPTPPTSWRRGVLFGAHHIGDILYNTASLPALSQAFPQCEWQCVADATAAQVLAGNPYLTGCAPALGELGKIDVAICYNSGAYWREVIAAAKRGIPNRVGYVHKGFSALVTHPLKIRYPQPFPVYFRDLVAQLAGVVPDWSLRPQVYPSHEDEENAADLASELGAGSSRPLLACFVTSRQPQGVLPTTKFGEALREIESASDAQTILFGAAEDREILERTKAQFHLRAEVAAGRLPLLALVCFLRRCTAVLCTDSGPRHLANAASVPAIYVRNLSFSKIEAGRYCDTEIDLAPGLEFVSGGAEDRAYGDFNPRAFVEAVFEVFSRRISSSP